MNLVSKGNKKTNTKKRKATSGAESPSPTDNNDEVPPHAINEEVGRIDDVVLEPLPNADGAKQISTDTPGIPPTPKKEKQALKEAWGLLSKIFIVLYVLLIIPCSFTYGPVT